MLHYLYLFIFVAFATGCSGDNLDRERKLSAAEFQQLLQEHPERLIIDARTPEEFEKGHLEGAININWNSRDFETQVKDYEKTRPLFVYCLSGGRSAKAATKLRKLGFTEVYEMPGGILEWRGEGFPETKVNTGAMGITQSEYDHLINADRLVLVDFYAEWCGPCKRMKPFLGEIAEDMESNLELVRIDVDENPEISSAQQISSIPRLKLYKNSQLVWEHSGYLSEARLRQVLSEFIGQ